MIPFGYQAHGNCAGGGPNTIPETSRWIGSDDPIQNGNTRSVKEQEDFVASMRCHADWRRSLGFLEQEDGRH